MLSEDNILHPQECFNHTLTNTPQEKGKAQNIQKHAEIAISQLHYRCVPLQNCDSPSTALLYHTPTQTDDSLWEKSNSDNGDERQEAQIEASTCLRSLRSEVKCCSNQVTEGHQLTSIMMQL